MFIIDFFTFNLVELFFKPKEELCTCGLQAHLGESCQEAKERTFSIAFNYDDGSIPL